ncbi:uncharacterized protein LOC142666252 [Rhinoderma darwinii]|uniref:uncharacterized protein LOC142666252 n=1 Tax=Rhinoderma darwinii TaxID=43563 RepID=UPI003F667B63
MRMVWSSLVPVFLILIPGKVMSDSYINQTPDEWNIEVGKSATISCSVAEKIDIREIYFLRHQTQIFNLTIETSNISYTLGFSGIFEKFKWTIHGDNMSSYTCTDTKDMNSLKTSGTFQETNQIDCPSPGKSSSYMLLNNGTKQIASLSMNSVYHSRLHISGTIRNLTITLKNLSKEDVDLYACTGKAEGIDGEIKEQHTVLKNHGINIQTGNMALALGIGILLI